MSGNGQIDRVSANAGRLLAAMIGSPNFAAERLEEEGGGDRLVRACKDFAFAIEDAVQEEIKKRNKRERETNPQSGL